MRKLIVFDLDGTLAESKSAIDAEMSLLLAALLRIARVAIISGGDWPQFERQVLARLPASGVAQLGNLFLLPTCGAKFYRHESSWALLYAEDLTPEEKERIVRAFERAMTVLELRVAKTWGAQIEDRGSQITFSALGQEAPIEQKAGWDPDFSRRQKMKTVLEPMLPGFSVRLGGTTSVDITRAGIDKAYGLRKLRDTRGIALGEMLFVGDALFPGGNDHPARDTGVTCIQVRDPNEAKRVIETLLAC